MIESLLSGIAFGTFGFWIVAFVAFILFTVAVECEKFTLGVIVALILGLFYWKSIVGVQWTWQLLTGTIGFYLVAGVLYSLFRFRSFSRSQVESFNEGKYGSARDIDDLKKRLTPSSNKSRLTGWIMYWPFSLLWHFYKDFFNVIYEAVSGFYQKIADSALSDAVVKK